MWQQPAPYSSYCEVLWGEDVRRRQMLTVCFTGAKFTGHSSTATLKDAMNEALRYWVANPDTHFYIIGTVAGPHPYPEMVRDFQSIIGKETKEQLKQAEDRLPDALIACIGGGSNALGLFHPFLDDESVAIYGVEAAGHGIETGEHAASLTGGEPGILHGNVPIFCKQTKARSKMLIPFPQVLIIQALVQNMLGFMMLAE